MKQIPLYDSGGEITDHAMVDDDVYEMVNRLNWHKTYYGYAARSDVEKGQPQSWRWMHRYIYETCVKPVTLDHIDHINRNRLDNTLSNLREVTALQNNLNRTKNTDTQTEYTGVKVDDRPTRGQPRYVAVTSVGNRSVHICYADNPRDAAIARDIYLQRLYPNDIIVLNVPEASFEDITRVAALMDRAKQRKGVSQYVGVSFDKRRNRWYSHVKVDYQSIYLGSFLTEIEAARAYNAYCIEHQLKRRLNSL